jgi:hypothetical protein
MLDIKFEIPIRWINANINRINSQPIFTSLFLPFWGKVRQILDFVYGKNIALANLKARAILIYINL